MPQSKDSKKNRKSKGAEEKFRFIEFGDRKPAEVVAEVLGTKNFRVVLDSTKPNAGQQEQKPKKQKTTRRPSRERGGR